MLLVICMRKVQFKEITWNDNLFADHYQKATRTVIIIIKILWIIIGSYENLPKNQNEPELWCFNCCPIQIVQLIIVFRKLSANLVPPVPSGTCPSHIECLCVFPTASSFIGIRITCPFHIALPIRLRQTRRMWQNTATFLSLCIFSVLCLNPNGGRR